MKKVRVTIISAVLAFAMIFAVACGNGSNGGTTGGGGGVSPTPPDIATRPPASTPEDMETNLESDGWRDVIVFDIQIYDEDDDTWMTYEVVGTAVFAERGFNLREAYDNGTTDTSVVTLERMLVLYFDSQALSDLHYMNVLIWSGGAFADEDPDWLGILSYTGVYNRHGANVVYWGALTGRAVDFLTEFGG